MRRLLVLLAVAFTCATAMPGGAQSANDDLARARSDKDRLQGELNAAAAGYQAAASALERTEAEITSTAVALAEVGQRRGVAQQVVARRAIAAYKGDRGDEVAAILGASDINTFADRAAYIARVAASDHALLDQLRAATADLEQARVDLARLEGEQREAVARADRTRAELSIRLGEANQQESYLLARKAAEDEARRQEEQARSVPPTTPPAPLPTPAAPAAPPVPSTSASTTAPPPTTQASEPETDFVCPVAGAVAYSDDFGDRRGHQGNDLFADPGTAAVAVRAGSVSFDEDPGGGGLVIYLSAGPDLFVYMHMESFSVADGASVAQGEQIGTVGMTGNATAPHLHFEIHPDGGAAVNPYPTISRAC